MRLRPFRALRPAPELAPRVAAPPYDVVSRAEASRLVAGNPLSFLRVSRAEVDLEPDTPPEHPRVHARARENLDRLVADGVLTREPEPALYLYRQAGPDGSRLGVAGCVHVDDYAGGVIKRHEATRPDKEEDRTRHLLALGAHPEPVLLAYRGDAALDALTEADTRAPALYDFTTPDGVRHTLWRVADPGRYVALFARVACAYVADGHHRSAAAWRAARECRATADAGAGEAASDWFPAVLVPAEQLRILPYHRLVRDLGGRSPAAVLERLAEIGWLEPAPDPRPAAPGSFGLYLDGRWFRLALPGPAVDRRDPVRSLEVSLLHDLILGPVLGIGDPRVDPRLDFVGGARGPGELARRVDAGEAAVAVALYPTTMAQLIAVSDAGLSMPPKSTWFEPKLSSGLFVHPFA